MDKERHFQLLGWLFIIYGILTGILLLVMTFAPHVMRVRPGPFAGVALLITAAFALFYAITGVLLISRRPWARPITIFASVLALFNFPFGTALGIYGLWVMFSGRSERAYGGDAGAGPSTPAA